MKPHTMQLMAALALAGALVSSCRTSRQHVDFTWFRDVCTPAQNDTVQVEKGQGLPAHAAPAPAAKRSWAPWQQQAASQQGNRQQYATYPAAPAATRPAASHGAASYTVQSGDTLSGIARKTGTSLSALYAANGLSESTAKGIRPGQTLRLPRQAASPTGTASTHAASSHTAPHAVTHGTYTVRKEDTLGAIAARHHTTTAALAKANRLDKQQADRLRPGQRLILPRP